MQVSTGVAEGVIAQKAKYFYRLNTPQAMVLTSVSDFHLPPKAENSSPFIDMALFVDDL